MATSIDCSELAVIVESGSKNVNARVFIDDAEWIDSFEQWYDGKETGAGMDYTIPASHLVRLNFLKSGGRRLSRYAKTVNPKHVELKHIDKESRELLVYANPNEKTCLVATTDFIWARKLSEYFEYTKLYDSYVEFDNIPIDLILRLQIIKDGADILTKYV